MSGPISRQEEDVMVRLALSLLGEGTRDEIAREIGIDSVFRTLARLEAAGEVVSEERYNATLNRRQRIYRLATRDEVQA